MINPLENEWVTVKLGSVCQLQNGFAFKSEDYKEQGVHLIRISDIKDGSVLPDKTVKISNKPEYEKFIVKKGDLLIAMSGATTGKFGIYQSNEKAYLNQRVGCFKILDKQAIDKDFLYYLITGLKKKIEKDAYGGAQPNIASNKVEAMYVNYPKSLKTQRQISRLLSQAQELIASRQHSLTLLDDFLKSTFLDLFGDPVKNEKGWERMRLEELADITSGVTKNTRQTIENPTEVPYMRVANVQDNKLDLTEIKTIEVSKRDAEKYLLQRNDILLTEGGDPDKLGRGVVWNNEIENCIHQNHIFRVRVYSGIEPHYLCNLFGSRYGKNYFLKAAKQTTGIASINSTQLKNFPAYVPDQKVQATFGRIVNQVETLKTQQRESLAQLQQLYQSLLQRAFTGELDVRAVELPKPNMSLTEDYYPPKPPKMRRHQAKNTPLSDNPAQQAPSFWEVPGTNWQQPPMQSEQRVRPEKFDSLATALRIAAVPTLTVGLSKLAPSSQPTATGLTEFLATTGSVSFGQLRMSFDNVPYKDLKQRVFMELEQGRIGLEFDDETGQDLITRLSGRIKLALTNTP